MRRIVLMMLLAFFLGSGPSTAWSYNTEPVRYVTYITPHPSTYYLQQSYVASQSPNTILQRLKARNAVPPELGNQVQIVPSQQLNASTNGQNIYITDKLWNILKTNDQRAFVIGHELGHILANHIQKTQARRLGLGVLDQYVVGRFIPQGSLWSAAESLGINLVDKHYSRDMEYQADDLGLQLMKKARYKPQAAIQVLEILQRNSRDGMPAFLMDHPLDASRIQRLVNRYDLAAK